MEWLYLCTKGIRETLGNGNRFQKLPKHFKMLKVATIRSLPAIICTGHLWADNVENIHQENGYMFAYINNTILVDEKPVNVRVAIKKKVSTNYFWIHNIDEI